MTVKVVDASAFAATVFLEREAYAIRARFADHQLISPALFRYEMANICWKKMRAQPEERDIIFGQFVASQTINIELRDVDLAEAVVLGSKFNLSAYDASYLWLARELGAELVTLDARLEQAAAKL